MGLKGELESEVDGAAARAKGMRRMVRHLLAKTREPAGEAGKGAL